MNEHPVFIDAHVHLKNVVAASDILHACVTAVRDAGMKTNAVSGRLPPRLHHSGLTIHSAGWAIYKDGGYGSMLGVPVETRQDIKREISRLKTAGAAIIKVVGSGIVDLGRPFGLTRGGFEEDELRLIAETAGDAGIDVMVHANGEEAVLAAAKAGVRSIEHGFFVTERALDLLAERRIFWVPTVGALVRAAEARGDKDFIDHVRHIIDGHLKMIKKAFDRGVPLAVGTDCVLPDRRYIEYYRAELEYLESAGLSRQDVFAIATEGGRRLLRI